MIDIVNSVTKLSQTSISQFFSPVTAEEARTANARTTNANVSQTDNDMPEIDLSPSESDNSTRPKVGQRLRGNLKVFQLNAAKKSESGSALSRLMGDCKNSLAFITEPPFYHGKVCGFSSSAFNVLHHAGSKKRCRAAIVASKGVELCPLATYTDEDTVSALSIIDGRKTCLVSSYMDRDYPVPEMLHKVCHFAAVNDYGLLICSDSNSHSPLWGSPDLNQRGRLVEEDLIYRYGLQLLNVGKAPTYIGHLAKTGTIVDITLATARTAASLTEWKVTDDSVISDHTLITFRTLTKITNKVTWNFRKADWNTFSECTKGLSENWKPVAEWTTKTIDDELISWYSDVYTALQKSCPKTKGNGCAPNKRGRTCPWWSKELEALKRTADKDYQYFRRWKRDSQNNPDSSEEEGDRLFEAKNISENAYKKAIRKAKRASWKKITSSLQNSAEMAKFCRGAFRKQRVQLGLVKRPNGELTTNPKESTKAIVDALFPKSVEIQAKALHRPASAPEVVSLVEGPTLYSDTMLQTAFKQFGNNKAAGTDGIKPILHHYLDWFSRRRLVYIMEASTRLAYVPRRWQISRISLMPKPNKEDYAKVKAWRPIAVLQATFKVHELLQKWLLDDSRRNRPTSDIQHAFVQGTGKGTDSAIAEVVDYLEQTSKRGEHCIFIKFDVDGAFNKTRLADVIKAMREDGFPDIFTNWYEAFVMNQIASVDTGLTRCKRRLTLGVPQGAITSPLAWNAYFEPVIQDANKGPCKVAAFADDFAVAISGPDLDTVRQVAQNTVSDIVKCGKDHGIEFNPIKTEVMHLGKTPPQEDLLQELSINGHLIPYSDEVTYLGMKLNRRLDWKPHIDEKIKAAKKKLMLLHSAIGKYWGPKPSLMLWAYKQVILPSLTYGCFVYAHKLDKVRLDRLKKVSRLAHQLLAPIARSTPTGGLEVITGTPPIHLEMQAKSLSTILRIDRPKPVWEGLTSKGSKGFYRHWSEKMPNQITKVAPDRCRTLFNWIPGQSMTMRLPDPLKWVGRMGVKTTDNPKGCWRINAAVKEWDDSIGVSHILITPDDYILEEVSKRYRLEVGVEPILLHRITSALDSLLEDATLLTQGCDVVVGSSFSRTLLATPLIRRKSLADLVIKTRQISQRTGNPVYFVKNEKCKGKEHVSELTRTSRELELSPSPFYNPKSVKMLLQNYRDSLWHEEWANSGTYHSTTNRQLPYAYQTKQWFPSPCRGIGITKFGRTTLGYFIQFFTGHGWFRRHRAKIDENSSECRFCNSALEDPEHLWSSCRKFDGVRHAIRQTCRDNNDIVSFSKPFVWSVTQLTRFFRDPKMVELLTGPGTDKTL